VNTFQDIEMDHATVVHRICLPGVRWGAIAAGVVGGLSIYLFLNLVGAATSLSMIDVTEMSARRSNAVFWAMLWISLSMLVAAFVGGYVAARMSGLKRGSDGMLHGFVSWSVTTLIVVLYATAVPGAVFHGSASGVYQSFTRGSATTAGTSGGAMLRQKLEALLQGNNAAAADVDPAVVENLREKIQTGQRGPAIDLMVNSLGFERERAVAVIDQALIVSQRPAPAWPDGPGAADRALKTVSGARWWLLGAATFSLLFGVMGGSLGSAGSRRVRRPDVEE
jgi:hypothetical protein